VRGYDISIESPEPPHPEFARKRTNSDLSPPGRGKEETIATPSVSGAAHPRAMTAYRPTSRILRFIAAIPKIFVAGLLIFVMLDLLAGVLLRYVVVQITDYFDLDPISFFWVEEVGEFGLAWLAAVGAAVALIERVHFALAVVTHRLAPRTQRIIDRVNHLLIAGFGALAAVYGWKLCVINSVLLSPGLGLNLAWLYASSVAGGGLIAIYGLGVAAGLVEPKDAVGGAH
jgi:TRAP-type C4-dicarboxylate transport system permease small subunit